MSWDSIPTEKLEATKQLIGQKPCLLLCSKTNGGQIASLTAFLNEYGHGSGRYLLKDGKEV